VAHADLTLPSSLFHEALMNQIQLNSQLAVPMQAMTYHYIGETEARVPGVGVFQPKQTFEIDGLVVTHPEFEEVKEESPNVIGPLLMAASRVPGGAGLWSHQGAHARARQT
jgi:hypothetical protein